MKNELSHPVANAIVVLGARIVGDGRASPALARRIELGIALFKAGLAKRLVLSGGGRGQERAIMREADFMRATAIAAGVPSDALLVERESHNTSENATEAARLLAPLHVRSLVLVTDRYHARRARVLFRAAGFNVVAVHSPLRPLRESLPQAVAELVRLPISLVRLLLERR